MFVTFGSFPT